jgi:SGNH hydrolase-like domain, acetyltransferase AlgX
MRLVKLTFLAIFATLLIAPVLYSAVGGGRAELGGVTAQAKRVPLSIETFLKGSFQSQIETRFSRWLAIFALLIKADNQINMTFLSQLSSNPKSKIVLGYQGHLIERGYLSAFNRQRFPKPERLAGLANQIALLHRQLAQRNKTLLLLISTNKPNFSPELVPSWYRVSDPADGQANHEIFLQLLRERGVAPVFSRDLLKAAETETGVPIFAPTGTHWNEFGACRVVAEIANRINQQYPGRIGSLQCTPRGWRKNTTDQDQDLLRAANVLFPKTLLRPSPLVVGKMTEAPGSRAKPRLLVVGTSFCWELLKVMNRFRLFGDREFLYYFRRQVLSKGGVQRPVNRDLYDVEASIDRHDVILLEVNEAFVEKAGYGFVQRALRRKLDAPGSSFE